MNILDENIPAKQRQLLERWRIHVRQIIPLLMRQRRATFFTRDADFYNRARCHSYCLVYLAVDNNETAAFVRRLLQHTACNTQAKRLGSVIRVTSAGLFIWRLRANNERFLKWE